MDVAAAGKLDYLLPKKSTKYYMCVVEKGLIRRRCKSFVFGEAYLHGNTSCGGTHDGIKRGEVKRAPCMNVKRGRLGNWLMKQR